MKIFANDTAIFVPIAAKWSQFQYALYCKYIDYECEIAKNKVKLQVTKDYR